MNNQIIKINEQDLTIKEYQGQRVVTFKDVDQVHGRPDGTAKRNFGENKNHLINGVDYFELSTSQKNEIRTLEIPNRGITVITESGYLMLVKSFTDDLAWTVQRQLVNSYFKIQEIKADFENLSPQLQLLINIETEQKKQAQALEAVSQRVDSIKEVVALDTSSWRSDAKHLITKIALKLGGYDYIKEVNLHIYKQLEERMGVNLGTRLTNKRRRMADNGVCKSTRDKLTKVDIIAEDKKLIEGYIAIIKEFAIKNGIDSLQMTA